MSNILIKNPIMTKEEYDAIVKELDSKKGILIYKRIFDLLFSLILILFLSPVILTLSILILVDSGTPIFFKQKRVGKGGRDFKIFKFRTMKNNSSTPDGITRINDDRITNIGRFLRKYRMDEIPQLFNIVKGDMSFVGPRPDLKKYYMVDDYGYKCVLLIKPGVTGEATLKFKDEDKILERSINPGKTYIEQIFPQKIKLNIEYIKKISIMYDVRIIFKTVLDVFLS